MVTANFIMLTKNKVGKKREKEEYSEQKKLSIHVLVY